MTTTNPLTALRIKGFNADLYQNRLRIWPRHKMSKKDRQFVTDNLQEILSLLNVEGFQLKPGQNQAFAARSCIMS